MYNKTLHIRIEATHSNRGHCIANFWSTVYFTDQTIT